ncbi:hypothetical protein WMY93_012259 [Mugilogobius chulae]|uniref:Uncharacterized protein n=1 Tax=Mugilogobius chulae TaxID=88201 RepID=A0AAW0P4Z6_9GOBI
MCVFDLEHSSRTQLIVVILQEAFVLLLSRYGFGAFGERMLLLMKMDAPRLTSLLFKLVTLWPHARADKRRETRIGLEWTPRFVRSKNKHGEVQEAKPEKDLQDYTEKGEGPVGERGRLQTLRREAVGGRRVVDTEEGGDRVRGNEVTVTEEGDRGGATLRRETEGERGRQSVKILGKKAETYLCSKC